MWIWCGVDSICLGLVIAIIRNIVDKAALARSFDDHKVIKIVVI